MKFFKTPELELEFRQNLVRLLDSTFLALQKPKNGRVEYNVPHEKALAFFNLLLSLTPTSRTPINTSDYPHGIQQVLEYFYLLSQKTKTPFDTFVPLLFSTKIQVFNQLIMHYASHSLLAEAFDTPDPLEFIKAQTMSQYRANWIKDRLIKTSFNLSPDIDNREVLTARPKATLLKRLDTIAIWVCPTKLSVCTAVTFFRNSFNISANMDKVKTAPILKENILRRLDILKTWCKEAIAISHLKEQPKEERIKFIVDNIITQKTYEESLIGGLSFEKPYGYLITDTDPSVYFREQLAKVVNTLFFDEVYAPLGNKFLNDETQIFLPLDETMKSLLSPQDFNIYKKLINPLRNVHAEQLLFLFGNKYPTQRNINHTVGISKCCCADCYPNALAHKYVVTGTHTRTYRGVIDLFKLSQRNETENSQTSTHLPPEDEGYFTPEDLTLAFEKDQKSKTPKEQFSLSSPSKLNYPTRRFFNNPSTTSVVLTQLNPNLSP